MTVGGWEASGVLSEVVGVLAGADGVSFLTDEVQNAQAHTQSSKASPDELIRIDKSIYMSTYYEQLKVQTFRKQLKMCYYWLEVFIYQYEPRRVNDKRYSQFWRAPRSRL